MLLLENARTFQIRHAAAHRFNSGALSLEAKLWYQSIRPTFLAAMPDRGDKVTRMKAMAQQQVPLPELLAQLAVGGRLIIPVGAATQYLTVVTRTPAGYDSVTHDEVRFVPLLSGLVR